MRRAGRWPSRRIRDPLLLDPRHGRDNVVFENSTLLAARMQRAGGRST